MHVQFGDYHVSDVEFVAAFDVDAKKVGQDLAHAITASENNTIKICDVPPTGVTVQRGHTLDGLGKYYRETIIESDEEPVDIVAALKESRADVLVCYLPVGSEQAASTTRSAPSTRRLRSSTLCRCSSPAPPSGRRSSPTWVFPSSATTSSRSRCDHHPPGARQLFEDRGSRSTAPTS